MPDGVLSSGVPADVEARLRTEVPGRGDRIIACLRTASWLLDRARGDAALMFGFLGGEVVSVSFLGDSRVGAVSANVLSFECLGYGAFTVLALCGGGKIPAGR